MGYLDTKQKIIETLTGRVAGTQIMPSQHQEFALSMLEYVRSVELISGSTLIGIAERTTVPVQPNTSNAAYIAACPKDDTVTFENFHDADGNAITVDSTSAGSALFIVLLWNKASWSYMTVPTTMMVNSTMEDMQKFLSDATTEISSGKNDALNAISTASSEATSSIADSFDNFNSNADTKKTEYNTLADQRKEELENIGGSADKVTYSGNLSGNNVKDALDNFIVQTTGKATNKVLSQQAINKYISQNQTQHYDNIIPTLTFTANTAIDTSGNEYSVSNYSCSDFVACDGGGSLVSTHLVVGTWGCSVAFFDADKKFIVDGSIVGGQDGTRTVTIPSTAVYVRFSNYTRYISSSSVAMDVVTGNKTVLELIEDLKTLANSKISKDAIADALGESADKVLSQKFLTSKLLKNVVKTYDNILTDCPTIETVKDYYISQSGTLVVSSGYVYTNELRCVPGSTIEYNLLAATNVAMIAYFDAEHNFLSSSVIGKNSQTSGTETIPSNVVYVRFCYNNGGTKTVKASIITAQETAFEEIESLNAIIEQLQSKMLTTDSIVQDIGDSETKVLSQKAIKTAFFKDKIVQYDDILTEYEGVGITKDYYINNTNQISASKGYEYTDYIKCVVGDEISVSLYALSVVKMVACYDADKNFISSEGLSGNNGTYTGVFTVPTGVSYIRFCHNYGPSGQFVKMQVNEGTQSAMERVNEMADSVSEIQTIIDSKVKNLDDKIIYSVFGDSISTDEAYDSRGHADGLSYPRTLAKLINAELDRYTVPGSGLALLRTNVFKSSTDASLVTVMYGINDLSALDSGSMVIGDIDEVMAADLSVLEDETTELGATFLGKYRYCMESLRNRLTKPNALICCISPCTNYTLDNPNKSRYDQNLVDMRNAIKDFVRHEGGPNNGWFYVDGTDILPWDALYFIDINNSPDSTHPNSMGEAVMAKNIFNRLPNINLYVNREHK